MFDGRGPEQIHRFIASPPPLPPLPPHQSTADRSLPFPDSFSSFSTNHQAHHMLSLDSRKIIHHHHDIKDAGATSAEWLGHTYHNGNNHHHHHPWCSDEVLALLRFRSTVENWFPEFNCEHTSRKLAEVGFKRSPQECKEKFEEEERRYFNTNNSNPNDHHISSYHNKGNDYRIFSEVEEFSHHGHDDEHVSSDVRDNQNKRNNSLEGKGNVEEETRQDLLEEDKRDQDQGQEEEASMENKINSIDVGNVEDDAKSSSSSSLMLIMRDKKRKKRKKEKGRFGVLKGFCEGLVRNMIAQQEEMHKKLLEDMVKKEEEKIAREEAWKKQEMERLNKEVEIREQAMASDTNTNIIKFISKFTDLDHDDDGNYKVQSATCPFQDLSSSPQTQGRRKFQTSSSLLPQTVTPHNPLTNDKSIEPISTQTLKTKTQNPKPPKGDLGKRWPKDEVLALINIRRSISSMNDDDDERHHKDGIPLSSPSSSSKVVPLWERISKKMLEVGYKRSAKRCKEKWENINKYFRKTKNVNKIKRPLDSRTCPYFHQLTALYSQPSTGTTATATLSGDLETRPEENRVESGDLDIPPLMHGGTDGPGEKSNVQFSGFDLAF